MSSNSPSNTQTAGENHSGGSRLSRNLANVATSDRDFKGDVSELGVVGLPIEMSNLTHGKTYAQFIVKLTNYCGRVYTNGDRLKPLLEELKDPVPDFESNVPVAPKKPRKKKKLSKAEKKAKRADDLIKLQARLARLQTKKSGVEGPPDTSESESESDSDEEDEAMELYLNEKHVWNLKIKQHLEAINELQANKKKLFALVMGQCTVNMTGKLKTLSDYEDSRKSSDSLWLLRTLKKIMTGVQDTHNPYMLAVTKLKEFGNCIQKPTETNEVYKERLMAALQALKVALGEDIFRSVDVGDSKTGEAVEDALLAAFLLQNADRVRHADRVAELEKDYEVGQDNIPTDPTKAFEILVSNEERLLREQKRYTRRSGVTNTGGGASGNRGRNFYQGRRRPTWPEGVERVAGTDGTMTIIQCHNCNKWGHRSSVCPTATGASTGGGDASGTGAHQS